MLASVSATTGVQAPIRYHLIYSISNLITGYWGCDRDTSRTGGRRGGRGGGCAIAIQPGPTTDVHGHEEKKIIYIYIYIQWKPLIVITLVRSQYDHYKRLITITELSSKCHLYRFSMRTMETDSFSIYWIVLWFQRQSSQMLLSRSAVRV